jgi:hypothetical protein
MAGRPPKFGWIAEARLARTALALAKEGERETNLRTLAGEADVNTLRRAIRAVDLLDKWTDLHAEASQNLASAPQTVLEVFSTWASLDEAAAWKAYEAWERKPTPVLALAKKLRKFRSRKGVRGSRGLEKDLRKRTAPHVKRFAREVLGDGLVIGSVEENARFLDEPMMDFRLRATCSDGKARSIAIVIVGPYRNPAMYGRRRIEWIQKAFALAWVHDHVILVLEDKEHVDDYRDWTRRFAAEALSRGVLRPDVNVIAMQ